MQPFGLFHDSAGKQVNQFRQIAVLLFLVLDPDEYGKSLMHRRAFAPLLIQGFQDGDG